LFQVGWRNLYSPFENDQEIENDMENERSRGCTEGHIHLSITSEMKVASGAELSSSAGPEVSKSPQIAE
jgi:hypothetical protein